MELVKDLIVTNVSPIKIGNYGGFRVTLNCYEKMNPTDYDTLYFIGLSLTSPALASLLDQLDIADDLDRKIPGERIRLPTGILINVACSEIKTDSRNKNIKYVNNVMSMELVKEIRVDVDVTFPARDIVFSDWGLTMQTKDGVYTQDKYLLFNDHVPFKSSSMMEKMKGNAPNDSIHLKGKAKFMYSTYKDGYRWVVKGKNRFDSRFDEMDHVTLDFNLESVKAEYVSKLKNMRINPSFKTLISSIGDAWKASFLSESGISKMAIAAGIDLDPVLVAMTFLSDDNLRVYMYLKSLLTDMHDVYYYQKSQDFKYVIMHDKASRQSGNYGELADQQKMIVFDVMMSTIYVFSCKEQNVNELVKEIVNAPSILYVDRLVEKTKDFFLLTSLKIVKVDPVKDWLEPVSETVFNP